MKKTGLIILLGVSIFLWGCGNKRYNKNYEVELQKPDFIIWSHEGKEISYPQEALRYQELYKLAYSDWSTLRQTAGEAETLAEILSDKEYEEKPIVQFYYQNGNLIEKEECHLTFFGNGRACVSLSAGKDFTKGYSLEMEYSADFLKAICEMGE